MRIALGQSAFLNGWLIPGIQNATTIAYSSDGVYLDESITAWSPHDLNPLNQTGGPGTRWLNFASLVSGASQVGTKVVMGEDLSFATALAGQTLAMGMSVGGESTGPFNVKEFYRAASPFGNMVLGDMQRTCLHLGAGSPEFAETGNPPSVLPLQTHALSYFRQYAAGYLQGAMPTVGWTMPGPGFSSGSFTYPYWPQDDYYDYRGKCLIAEKALYMKTNNKAGSSYRSLYGGPHAAWSSPNVIFVENVNGTPVARTEEWLVKVLFLDLWYMIANDVPSSTTMATYTNGKRLRDGTFFGGLTALTNVANMPSQNPIRSRQRVLWDIYHTIGMTNYPFVSFSIINPPAPWNTTGTPGAVLDLRNIPNPPPFN